MTTLPPQLPPPHTALFSLGTVILGNELNAQADRRRPLKAFLIDCLMSHQAGEWGDTDVNNARKNNEALEQRKDWILYSRWHIPELIKTNCGCTEDTIHIATASNRSRTTIMYESELLT